MTRAAVAPIAAPEDGYNSRETSSYLGYPIEITDREVTVFDKHGRRLVKVASIGAARRFITGYRRFPANAEAAPLQPAGERETASTHEGE